MHTSTSWRLCHCPDCRARMQVYNREYMRSLRADPGPRLVDAAPVRAHVKALGAAGLTLNQIADRSGYARGTLATLSAGRVQRVRAVMAEDLLSINADEVTA